MIIATWKLILVGVSLFSYLAFTHPEPCPRKYRVLQENGGALTYLGDIHKYCDLDYGGNFKLKKEYVD